MEPVNLFGIFILITLIFTAFSTLFEEFFKRHSIFFRIVIYTCVLPGLSLLCYYNALSNEKDETSSSTYRFEEYKNSGLEAISDVNLRNGPSTNSRIILVVSKSEIVNHLNKKNKNGWIYVRYKDTMGWIYQRYLKVPEEIKSRFGTNEKGFKLLYYFIVSDDNDPLFIFAFIAFSLIFSFGATLFSYAMVPNVGTLIIYSVTYYSFMFYYNDIVVNKFSSADKLCFFGGLLLYTIIVDLLGDLVYYLFIKDDNY